MKHIIDKYKNKIFDDKIYFYPEIARKKLNNAIKHYADIGDETPLALIDDTLFGSAKAGLLLTNRALYIKDGNEKNSFSCLLENIETVSFKNYLLMQNLTINETLKITFTQPNKKALSLFSDMLLELNGIQLEDEGTSWSNIGIGAGIGALFGGPIGAAIGGAIGASLENKKSEKSALDNNIADDIKEIELIFVVTLASMMAKIAKADGVITKAEANQISEVLDELDFSNTTRDIAIKAFNNAKNDGYTIYDYAKQYREISDYDMQEYLYATLWIIALSDGELHKSEKRILKKIPTSLGLPQSKYNEFFNDYTNKERGKSNTNELTIEECYGILGCTEDNSMIEIKKKYRILISDYHPDKIQSKGLPESFIIFATEQMQKINLAYDTIKNNRK